MTEQGGVSYMDGILRISLMGGQARAFLVESTHTVEHARRVHHLSHTATAALGRTLTATAVLGGDFNTRQRPVFALLEHMESTGLCRFIPLHGTFHKNGRWQAEDGGQLMYCDDNHLSPYGAKKMVGGIIDQLFPGMERTAAN